jgi:MFS family permease
MKDIGFTPSRGKSALEEVKGVLRASLRHGLGNRPVRWIMLGGVFTGGAVFYAFYAMQPYLLELYGDERAYAVAGLAAAILAGAQIAGGLLVPRIRSLFARRTGLLITGTALGTGSLAAIGLFPNFWIALGLIVLWGLMFAVLSPVRQAYLNALIPSEQRATVLSFDSLLGSGGSVATQPALGRIADIWGYPTSYVCSALVQALSLPFLVLASRERAAGDTIDVDAPGK